MKFLFLNQTFYPDVVATAQLLADAAQALARRGHDVTVICGRRAYDDPARLFPPRENWNGVRVLRVGNTAFGKGARWRRAADFASFMLACVGRLAGLRRPDVVVTLTSPPLISVVGAWYARLVGARLIYWVMDLNPDEAIAAGWLREGRFVTRLLHGMSRFSFRRADKIIALDRFMRARIEGKGIAAEKIIVSPPWAHDGAVRFDPEGRERFRKEHGLDGKFVVMYSGNHSPCHPLDTLLAAARALAADPRFVFLFVGGGSEFRKIQRQCDPATRDPHPANVKCLPYQPMSGLSASLSAADLQVVVMGDPFVGVIHPCKLYNVLKVGAPVLYIGPAASHVTELLDALDSPVCARVAHGQVADCADAIRRIAARNERGEPARYAALARQFSQGVVLSRLVAEWEGVVAGTK